MCRLCVSQIRWGVTCTLLTDHRNIETLYHSASAHVKMINITERKNLKHVRGRIRPHVQNTLSLQYNVWKNHKKRQSKPRMHLVIHREALSVIRCILLQAYSHWYLLQSGEKRSALSSNGNSFTYIYNTSCGAKGLCHWSEETTFRMV